MEPAHLRATKGLKGISQLLVPLQASLLQLPSCSGEGSLPEKVLPSLEPLKALFFVEERSVKISQVQSREPSFQEEAVELWEMACACLLTVYCMALAGCVCG